MGRRGLVAKFSVIRRNSGNGTSAPASIQIASRHRGGDGLEAGGCSRQAGTAGPRVISVRQFAWGIQRSGRHADESRLLHATDRSGGGRPAVPGDDILDGDRLNLSTVGSSGGCPGAVDSSTAAEDHDGVSETITGPRPPAGYRGRCTRPNRRPGRPARGGRVGRTMTARPESGPAPTWAETARSAR
jgi:hypothetical protein